VDCTSWETVKQSITNHIHSENIFHGELIDLKIIQIDLQDSEHVEVVDTIRKLRFKWTDVQSYPNDFILQLSFETFHPTSLDYPYSTVPIPESGVIDSSLHRPLCLETLDHSRVEVISFTIDGPTHGIMVEEKTGGISGSLDPSVIDETVSIKIVAIFQSKLQDGCTVIPRSVLEQSIEISRVVCPYPAPFVPIVDNDDCKTPFFPT
jgi:hypothetical protein